MMLERWSADAWPASGPRPIPAAYWVRPGRLLAGAYPGGADPEPARARLRSLLGAGITDFVDLTEADEGGLPPYAPTLAAEAAALGREVRHLRAPIRDFGIPAPDALRATLDQVDAALLAGRNVYLHCWGGIGRTGTLVGCHLVRHGLTGPEALALIARLRRPLPGGERESPETAEQRALVLGWGRGA